jgi:hypothetical protein
MIAGIIDVDSITWGDRGMQIRGQVEDIEKPVALCVSYAHMACTGLLDDGDHLIVHFYAGHAHFAMRFQDESVARDAAAELTRHMEAAR